MLRSIRFLLTLAPLNTWGWSGLLVAISLIKLWSVTGVELGKDEAAYWYWSQHLDATYALVPFALIGLGHALYPGSEVVLRALSVGAGLAAAFLLYRLCRLHGLAPTSSRWATAAFVASHWIWHNSSFLHPDAFLVLFWLLALVFARLAQQQPQPLYFAAMGVAAGLALLSKYSGALLMAGLGLWLVLKLPKGHCRGLLWYGIPAFLVSVPLLWAQWRTGFFLPATLGSLSRIADQVTWRLPLFLVDPLLFVSPLLLWLLYRSFGAGLRQWHHPTGRPWHPGLITGLVVLGAFGFFALAKGQIKGNWILPAFLGLWPRAFAALPAQGPRPRLLIVLLLTSLLHSLPVAWALRHPEDLGKLGSLLAPLDDSYVHLVASQDRPRESAYTWTQRLGDYHGWEDMAARLERELSHRGLDPALPLVSPHYGLTFALAYYSPHPRPLFTVADPRFRLLADFNHLNGPALPSKALAVVHSQTDLPAALTISYQPQLLTQIERQAPGCPPIRYRVFLLHRR